MPISNTSEDLSNILLFLEDEASKDLKAFKENVVHPIVARPHIGQTDGFEKDFGSLHSIFRRVLLRRDKTMTVGGVSIVSLKKKTITRHLAKFSKLEKRIYEAVYQMGKKNFQRFSNQSKSISMAKFIDILENFLRIRQTCCDVGLLLDAANAKKLQRIKASNEDDDDDENPQEMPDDDNVSDAPGVDRGSAEMEHDATVMNNDLSDFKIKSESYGILSVKRRAVVNAKDLSFLCTCKTLELEAEPALYKTTLISRNEGAIQKCFKKTLQTPARKLLPKFIEVSLQRDDFTVRDKCRSFDLISRDG